MDDAHIFSTREQVGDELKRLLKFVLDLLRGLRPVRVLPGAVPPGDGEKEKFVGSDEDWAHATAMLAEAAAGVRPGAGGRPGRRRVLRAQDLGAGQGRDRP